MRVGCARFFHVALWMVNYCSMVIPIAIKRLHDYKNDGCTRVRTPLYCSTNVKTETFSPQNDHTMELNANVLLTTTVAGLGEISRFFTYMVYM